MVTYKKPTQALLTYSVKLKNQEFLTVFLPFFFVFLKTTPKYSIFLKYIYRFTLCIVNELNRNIDFRMK